jgi:stress response protein YsnF
MLYEKIVAVYETEASANAALKSLMSAGYLTDDISVIRNERDAEKAGLYEPGIWQRLFGRDLEHHEAAVLGRSLKEGSVIVSVRVPETEASKVLTLLDTHKPVDIVDRAKADDFRGATAGMPAPAGMAAPAGIATMAAASKMSDEEMLRVAEEQIDVGKRIVEAGHTRVRRFVVDKPVEAKISLHEEHAEVIRRAISDPAYLKDIDWSEKTIDVTETAEEPVVNKTVRFTEEIVVRRQGSDSMRTVHDTVRSQRVEVDHLVGAGTKK